MCDLLFIHHSCGGQWLANPGAEQGHDCIYASHPHGGGLRARLEERGYRVHEASYGSRLGQHTDLFDWVPKFRDQMDAVLRCDSQDVAYRDGRQNRIVMFKSCFPNNAFVSDGDPAGMASGSVLTVDKAKAAFGQLLGEFCQHPEVLFIYVTAPPLAAGAFAPPWWRRWTARWRGRGHVVHPSGRWARAFNNWVSRPDGWLRDAPVPNVAVFDYYDVLTAHGRSDYLIYGTENPRDSHPGRQGNEEATRLFLPFLETAVRRAGVERGAESEAV